MDLENQAEQDAKRDIGETKAFWGFDDFVCNDGDTISEDEIWLEDLLCEKESDE